MRSLRNVLAGSTLAVAAVFTTGCESLLFGFANGGLEPPETTVTYAPELGLALDVYRPQRAGAGTSPVVVFFYGGNWQRGERGQYRFVARRLARNGVLAIVADYRTWPDAEFPGFMDDAARAVAWAREHAQEYGGEPRQLFIAGHSAGAQIAGLLGSDGRYLDRHGLELADIAGVVGLSGPYDFVISGRYRKVFGPPAQWPQAQAINHVDGDEPPFLLIHGADDGVVEARDSVQMAGKLREHGVAAELLVLPDAGHSTTLLGLYQPQRAPAVLPAVLGFIRAAEAAGQPASGQG
ncbi:alpha/beta hydrolase [Lysobacter sp. D1-1-M9]|uniref:alpha/beta hydrolase n=2 Tax=Novilysobacter TaxID=3382699 RepID=UPI002FCC8C5E